MGAPSPGLPGLARLGDPRLSRVGSSARRQVDRFLNPVWARMPIDPLRDPRHWRERAEELRVIAEATRNVEAKVTLLRIVADYERLAQRAGRRTSE